MTIVARMNHVGWIHLWRSREQIQEGEASLHFFDPRIDPFWREVVLTDQETAALRRGEPVEIEDPGYLEGEET